MTTRVLSKHLRLFGTALALAVIAQSSFAVPIEVGPDGVLMKDGRPYRAVGINFVDAFWRHFFSASNTTYVQGFNTLVANGVPFVRIAIAPMWPSDMKMYVNNRATYLSRLDDVIHAAENAGIGLVTTFFWKHFTIPDIVGERVNQWGNLDSETIAFMHEFVETIVTRYVDSPAIWAWEFGNEWSLDGDIEVYSDGCTYFLPPVNTSKGTPSSRTCEDLYNSEEMVTALNEFTAAIRAIDPNRPISSGHSIPRSYAEEQRLDGIAWTELDTFEEYQTNFLFVNPAGIDLPSIHLYPDDFTIGERWTVGHIPSPFELLSVTKDIAASAGKCLFLGEFGAQGTTPAAVQTNLNIIDAAVASRIALAAVWVYDYGGNDGWNITYSNARKQILTAVAEANEFLAAQLDAEWNVDSDQDGLPDVVEDENRNGIVDPGETDPDNPDTDGDNVRDGDEVAFGYDPLDENDTPELPAVTWTGLTLLALGLLAGGAVYISSRLVARTRSYVGNAP